MTRGRVQNVAGERTGTPVSVPGVDDNPPVGYDEKDLRFEGLRASQASGYLLKGGSTVV
jgi:hypothetical protein